MQTRLYETVYAGTSRRGQRIVGLRCPFCDTITEAHLWSLAGSGKRCECGAIFRHHSHAPFAEKQ